jgi:MFS transporter, DHA1 family, tetracycline resistance protein
MAEATTTATSSSSRPGAGRAAFAFILVTVLFDFLAFGIIAPVLPNLIIQFEGGNISSAAAITGYFGFAWALMQFIFSPILGAWSDRFGRRPVILISCFGLGLDYIFMALAPSLKWLLVGRIISGITASNISSAFAYVTDVTPAEKRAKQFGYLAASFGMGFIIGPAVGGFLGNINLRFPFWAAAALSLANAMYGLFVLPESLPKERRSKSAWHMANPLGSLTLLRSHRQLFGLATVMTLFYLAQQSLPAVFVIYTQYRYAWTKGDVGLSLAVVGVSTSIVSGMLVGPFVRRFGERRSVVSGLTFGTLGFLSFAFAPRGWMFLCAIPFLGLWGIAGPSVQSLMSRRVDPTSQGKLQGAINSIRAISGMIGPLLFTQVLALAISPSIPIHFPGASYFLAAVLLFSSLLLAVYVTRPSELTQSASSAERKITLSE